MISELVALASCLMLSVAQLQIPQHSIMQPHQIALLPNLQPMQISSLPNSQIFMTQAANTVLSHDVNTPLNPGFLEAMPVVVQEATQNMLDQESKIVGYNVPLTPAANNPQNQFFTASPIVIPITQGPRSQPQIIPVTAADAVNTRSLAETVNTPLIVPQSLRTPVLANSASRHFSRFFPIRDVASLKNLIGPVKPKFSPAFSYRQPSINRFRPLTLSANSASKEKLYIDIPSHPILTSRVNNKVYYDIPPNHPVPKPTSRPANVYYDIPPNHPIPPPYSKNASPSEIQQARQPEQPTNFSQGSTIIYPVFKQNYNEIDYMRPPPPPAPQPHNHNNYFIDQASAGTNNNVRKHHRSAKLEEEPENKKSVEEQGRERVVFESTVSLKKPKDTPRFLDQLKESLSKVRFSNTEDVGPKYVVSQSEKIIPSRKLEEDGKVNVEDSSPDFSEHVYYQQALAQGYNTVGGYSGYSSDGYANQKAIVHKHIFVHSAPQQYSQRPRVQVIRAPASPEKHVNIIFVKAPQDESPPQTIVELPPNETPKTVVYVLSKKQPEGSGQVKFVKPPPNKVHKPEIYFIRYGDKRGEGGYGYGNRGIPVPNLQSLYESNHYGGPTLPQPQRGGSDVLSIMPPPPAPPARGLFHSNFRTKRDRDYGLETYAPLMAYSTTGQINEITREEADARKTSLDAFF